MFKVGERLPNQGGDHGGRRPTRDVAAQVAQMRKRIMRRLLKDADVLYDTYIKWSKVDAATIRHAIDKLLPDEQPSQQQPTTIAFQFVQFTSNNNTLQLPATPVSAPILVGDDRGQEESGREGMASEERQRQDGLKFHSFSNVPTKPR